MAKYKKRIKEATIQVYETPQITGDELFRRMNSSSDFSIISESQIDRHSRIVQYEVRKTKKLIILYDLKDCHYQCIHILTNNSRPIPETEGIIRKICPDLKRMYQVTKTPQSLNLNPSKD